MLTSVGIGFNKSYRANTNNPQRRQLRFYYKALEMFLRKPNGI